MSAARPLHSTPVQVKRDAHGRLLPGASLNPGGKRPSFGAAIRARYGEDGERLIEFLASVVDGTATADKLSVVRDGADSRADLQKVGPTMMERIEAAKMLRDSGYGKPSQAIELSGPGGGPLEVKAGRVIDVDAYTDAELGQLEALLSRGRELPEHVVDGEIVEGEP